MKKYIIYSMLALSFWFLTTGMDCQSRDIQVPVLGIVDHPFVINTNGTSFSESEMIDFTDQVNQIKADNGFDSIYAILLQGVSFTVTDNNTTPAGVIVNGTATVSSTSFDTMQPLASMTGLNLDAIEDVEQSPDLDPLGVIEINKAISPIVSGSNQLYFNVSGLTTTTPPVHLQFTITAKISITVIGILKTEVPVM